VRRTLVDAFVDLLTCESVAIAATRLLHTAPSQMSVAAAVAKYFVPTIVERVLRSLSVLLGARSYVRDEQASAIFQKIVRDAALLPLFDGSTIVNLNSISHQLGHLKEHRARLASKPDLAVRERLRATFALDQPLPPFEPRRLALLNLGADDVVGSLGESIGDLERMQTGATVNLVTALHGQARQIAERLSEQERAFDRLPRSRHVLAQPAEAIDLAEDYCRTWAAAACLRMWLDNRAHLAPFAGSGEWLGLALSRLGADPSGAEPQWRTELFDRLIELALEERAFSLAAMPLPAVARAGAGTNA
jgi:hypothetical protein